jgi:hypothetical protein
MKSFDIECGKCGEEFEADIELAGQTLDCPECGAPIIIPSREEIEAFLAGDEEEAEADSEAAPEDSGEEETPEEKPAAPKSPARARGGKRAPRRAPGKKSSGPRTRPKKSNKGIYLALAIGVLILGACGVIFLVAGPGAEDGDAENGEDADSSETSDEPDVDPQIQKQNEELYRKALAEAEGSDDPALWVEAGNLAEGAGLDEDARKAWQKALEVKEGYKPALRKLGYRKFSLKPEAEELEIVAASALEELMQFEGKWLAPDEYDRVCKLEDEVIKRIRDDLRKRDENPFYDAAKQVESMLGTRKGLNSRMWKWQEDKPYLVFEDKGAKGGNLQPDALAERKLADKLRMLKFLYKYMMDRWFSPLGFRHDEKVPLVVISLMDRKAFDDLHREMGMGVPPGALAYFHRIHRYIILYNGAFDRSAGSYMENKAQSDGVVFHEGVHQIVNFVLNAGRGFNSTETIYLPYWLNEGIAEYVGSVDIADDPDEDGNDIYIPGSVNKMRLQQFYEALHPEKSRFLKPINMHLKKTEGVEITHPYAVDVEKLLESHDHESTARAVAKMYENPKEGEKAAEFFSSQMPYYQGTFFLHFCYNYKSGKYAKAFDEFLANCFKGYYYADNFRQAFGNKDLDELTKEWFAYIEELAQKHLFG